MIEIYYMEEDKRIAQAVKKFLAQAGYHVCVFPTIDEIKEALNRMRPALVLVDWHMPNGNGSLLCQWLRENWCGLPVLFIAARSPVHSLITEPEDYVVKPFELDALLVRIRTLLQKRTFSVFLAIFHVLKCLFLIFRDFQFSRHIPGPTVCISHFSRFSVISSFFKSSSGCFSFSMIFSFLAIFHVLQWTFVNFPPF